MVETSASPTMSADAVCAVRRGLRMEFSRPSFPDIPNSRASGRPITLAIGRATTGASIPIPMKRATAPSPTSWMAGLESPNDQDGDAEHGEHRADGDPAAGRLLLVGSVIGQCGDRWNPDRTPGRADGRDDGHPDADEQRDDDRAPLEDERSRREGDAEPLEQCLEAHRGEHAQPQTDERRHDAQYERLSRAPSGTPGGGWPRRCGAARAHGCAGRR